MNDVQAKFINKIFKNYATIKCKFDVNQSCEVH